MENLAIGYMKKFFCPEVLFDTLAETEKGIIMLVTLIPAAISVLPGYKTVGKLLQLRKTNCTMDRILDKIIAVLVYSA